MSDDHQSLGDGSPSDHREDNSLGNHLDNEDGCVYDHQGCEGGCLCDNPSSESGLLGNHPNYEDSTRLDLLECGCDEMNDQNKLGDVLSSFLITRFVTDDCQEFLSNFLVEFILEML